MSHRHPDFISLMEFIHDGPLENPPWQGFLRALCEVLALDGASITLWESDIEPTSTYVLVKGAEDPTDWLAAETEYYVKYAAMDPIGAARLCPGEVRFAATTDSDPGLRSYLSKYGIAQAGRACFAEPAGAKAWLEFFRRNADAPFKSGEVDLIRELLPSLSRSLRIYLSLMLRDVERTLYEETVDHFAIGTVLVDGHGFIMHKNKTAAGLLAGASALRLRNNRLAVAGQEKNTELQRAVDKAINRTMAEDTGSSTLVSLRYGDKLYGLLVRQTRNPQYFKGRHTPHAVIHIVEIDRDLGAFKVGQPAAIDLLSRLFSLTRQEAKTALLLSESRSLMEISGELQVAEVTARNYSKKIYQKLGIARRSDLVRIVQRSMALIR